MTTNLEVLESKNTFQPTEEYPWNPLDDREFFCKKLSNHVKMTGNLTTGGIYYVTVVGANLETRGRQYPVLGRDLVLADSIEARKIHADEEFLPVNLANWSQIKNFLCDRFIHSYPWTRSHEKTTEQIRAEMLALAKSPRAGLAKMIENERNNNGLFLDISTFVIRMEANYASFPWRQFSKCIELSVPLT